MRLKFNFNNGTPTVEFNEEIGYSTPLELNIQSTDLKSKKNSLDLYIKALDYLFRGVANYASGNITNISVEKGWFGKIEKDRETIKWDAVSDKSFVVVYDIKLDSLTENMYVADGVASGGKGSFKGVDPVWIKELLQPNPQGMKENIISSIEVATEFITDYKLAWGFNGQQGLSILDSNNRVISAEEIDKDETFVLIKLLTLLMGKGTHMGVFLVDCKGFSDEVLNALTQTAKVFFGDAYIFFYNVPENSQVERKVVNLPDFLQNK